VKQCYYFLAPQGREFEVARELSHTYQGIWCPKEMYLYRGKHLKMRPALPGYIFAWLSPPEVHRIKKHRWKGQKREVYLNEVGGLDERDLSRFQAEIDTANESVRRAFDNRKGLCAEYAIGTELEGLNGVLEGLRVTFQGIKVQAGDGAKYQVDTGRFTMLVDPADVAPA